MLLKKFESLCDVCIYIRINFNYYYYFLINTNLKVTVMILGHHSCKLH